MLKTILIRLAFSLVIIFSSGPASLATAQSQAPATATPDVRLGAVEAWMAPQAAADLRVGWDRMVVRWSLRQPDNPEQWIVPPEETERINTALAAGREMVILIMGTPGWATNGEPQGGPPRGLYLPTTSANHLWAVFLRRFFQDYETRFNGQITRYIIWNEPDIAPDEYGAQFTGTVRDYYQLVKTAALVGKAINPSIKIHLAGMTYWHDAVFGREAYLQRFIEVARLDPTARANNYYFDVVTIHIYFRTETVRDLIGLFRSILNRYGLKHPIWLNETNSPPADDEELPWDQPMFRVSMEEQAAFILQTFALGFASGAERVSVYKLFNFDAVPGADYYGLIRPDGSPRPALQAFRLVTSQFAGARRVAYIPYSTHYIVRLEREDALVQVLWARGPKAVNLSLLADRRAVSATLYSQFGQAQPLNAIAGRYPLTLAPANCATAQGCVVGGPTWVLVETYRPK